MRAKNKVYKRACLLLKPFSKNLLYPLKASENRKLSDDFRGCRRRILVENGFMPYY